MHVCFHLQVNQYGISEVEQMIWEVDEDSDGCVSLEEFQLMFDRGRNDRTGHEVRSTYLLCHSQPARRRLTSPAQSTAAH